VICQTCRETFANRFSLKRHQKTHTGAKPHVSFVDSVHLLVPFGFRFCPSPVCFALCVAFSAGGLGVDESNSVDTLASCFDCVWSTVHVFHVGSRFCLTSCLFVACLCPDSAALLRCILCCRTQFGTVSTPFLLSSHPLLCPPLQVCTFGDCTRTFAEKATLIRHVRVHTGERP
jgi:hypothetical protein